LSLNSANKQKLFNNITGTSFYTKCHDKVKVELKELEKEYQKLQQHIDDYNKQFKTIDESIDVGKLEAWRTKSAKLYEKINKRSKELYVILNNVQLLNNFKADILEEIPLRACIGELEYSKINKKQQDDVYNIEKTKRDSLVNKIDIYVNYLKDILKNVELLEGIVWPCTAKEYQEHKASITNYKTTVIPTTQQALDLIEKNIQTNDNEKFKLEVELLNLEKENSLILNNELCPTCNQPLKDRETLVAKFQVIKIDLTSKIKVLGGVISELKPQQLTTKNTIDNYKQLVKTSEDIVSKCDNIAEVSKNIHIDEKYNSYTSIVLKKWVSQWENKLKLNKNHKYVLKDYDVVINNLTKKYDTHLKAAEQLKLLSIPEIYIRNIDTFTKLATHCVAWLNSINDKKEKIVAQLTTHQDNLKHNKNIQKELDQFKSKLEVVLQKLDVSKILERVFHKDGLPRNMMLQNLSILNELFNFYISKIDDGMKGEYITEDKLKSSNETREGMKLVLYHEGKKKPTNLLSAGEAQVIALMERAAFCHLYNMFNENPIDFIMLDEIFAPLDQFYREKMFIALKVLSETYKQIFVISHSDLQMNFDHLIKVIRSEEDARAEVVY